MKMIIQHHHDGSGCILKMDDETRMRVETLGSKALEILERQDPVFWAHASADTGFLKLIKKGAGVLSHLGVHATINMTNEDAHRAFVACCLLALRITELTNNHRRTLRQALLILSECCALQINPVIVPPHARLPESLKKRFKLVQIYEKLIKNKLVSLADLHRLLLELERRPSPTFIPLVRDLRVVTEGFRKALEQTKSTSRQSKK